MAAPTRRARRRPHSGDAGEHATALGHASDGAKSSPTRRATCSRPGAAHVAHQHGCSRVAPRGCSRPRGWLASMLRRLAMLLLVSCGQAATPSQRQLAKRQLAKRQLIVKQLAMTWGGTQGAMSGDDLATGQGVMRRDDPVLCRADPISCSATPVELDCRRSTASAGGAPSACLQDVYSAIMHYVAGPSLPSGAQPTLRDRDMAPLSKLLADGLFIVGE